MSRRRRIILTLFVLLLAAFAAGFIALDRWQRHTIFSVELGEQRWWREALPGTEVRDLPLPGGDTVRAWYVAQSDPAAPAVLYLHGARWNLNGSVFRMERWAELGYSVLAIDYRGFGESTPRLPSQAMATEDALAGLQELARRQPDPARRFVYGHSLGGAVAAQLAAREDAPAFAGLILESTFTNIRDMLSTTRGANIPGLRLLVTQPFDSARALAGLDVPVLLLHGTADRVVPSAMSEALHAAVRRSEEGPSRLVLLDGASHSGASRSPGYAEAVRRFTQEASATYAAR